MKVAVLASPRFAIKQPFAGGLEAFVASLMAYYGSYCDVTLYAHPDSETEGNFRTFAFDDNTYAQYPDIVENDFILKCMKDIQRQGFDVIHNNSLSSIPAVWACKNQFPLLTTLHTPPYTRLKAGAELASFSPYVHYNAVSYSVAEMWRPFINDDISVIHNGIDLSAWSTQKKQGDYAVTYGRIAPSKGIDLAIHAARASGIGLKIAGPIFNQDYYKQKVAPLLSEDVEYLGHLDHSRVCDLLAGARMAVFGTRWDEPFGLSTVESMATGTPVAAFNRGAFPELVSVSGGALAKGNNVISLAEAMNATALVPHEDIIKRASLFPLSKMCNAYLNKLAAIA